MGEHRGKVRDEGRRLGLKGENTGESREDSGKVDG